MNDAKLLANIELRAKRLFRDPYAYVKPTTVVPVHKKATDEPWVRAELWATEFAHTSRQDEVMHGFGATFYEALRQLDECLASAEDVAREDYEIRKEQDELDRIAEFASWREVV